MRHLDDVLVVLLARQGNALIHARLIGAPQESHQGLDDGVHMRQLGLFERGKTGRHVQIFGLAADALQFGDGRQQALTRSVGGQRRGVVEGPHHGMDALNYRRQVFRRTQVWRGGGRGGRRWCSLAAAAGRQQKSQG